MLIGDCAGDPPLGATARALAVERADDVVWGLGALALTRAPRGLGLALAVRDEEARARIGAALAALDAKVELVTRAPAWPPAYEAGDVVVPAHTLVQLADEARGRAAAVYVTVAGAVREPCALRVAPGTTMAELVERAGGALADDWVAVAGGAPAGRLAAREDSLADARDADGSTPSLVLALPATHEVVRRLRTPLGDWLRRAASACAGCDACSARCPVDAAPHALLATLVRGDDAAGVVVACALACSGCGLCDAVCPARLSPRALATALRDRLAARGGSRTRVLERVTPHRGGLDLGLLTLRLGLGPYDRPVSLGGVRA